jgi:hypothetical protein
MPTSRPGVAPGKLRIRSRMRRMVDLVMAPTRCPQSAKPTDHDSTKPGPAERPVAAFCGLGDRILLLENSVARTTRFDAVWHAMSKEQHDAY